MYSQCNFYLPKIVLFLISLVSSIKIKLLRSDLSTDKLKLLKDMLDKNKVKLI
jgi:hypothetical protein